jgi:hypothetical protein
MDISALSKQLITIGLLIFLSACSEDGGEIDSRVVIATGDTIIPLNDEQYQLPLVVQVADSDGSPQANAEVQISLTTISFMKGYYTHQDTSLPADGTTDKWLKVDNFVCPAEDINNNVKLDPGEDINGNGLLEPETPTITSHPTAEPTLIPGTSTIITNDNGFGYLTISYPKTEASWVVVRMTATTQGGLPENRDVYEFPLFVLLDDLVPADDPPAFVISPYGITADCTSTN